MLWLAAKFLHQQRMTNLKEPIAKQEGQALNQKEESESTSLFEGLEYFPSGLIKKEAWQSRVRLLSLLTHGIAILFWMTLSNIH